MSFFVFVFLLAAVLYLLSRVRFLHLAHADDLRDLRAEIEALKQRLNTQTPARTITSPPKAAADDAEHGPVQLTAVNLNSASKTALQRIPKVGAVCAKRVIEARPLASLEQLDTIAGLTTEQLAQLKRFGQL